MERITSVVAIIDCCAISSAHQDFGEMTSSERFEHAAFTLGHPEERFIQSAYTNT